ncbi:MAG TPA: hypothetical protein VH393_17485 [Ktedonobacterales bacterium]
MAAGFIDFEITWRAAVYADAPQESSAEDFGTLGITFFARKPLTEQEREDYLARQMCELPTSAEKA